MIFSGSFAAARTRFWVTKPRLVPLRLLPHPHYLIQPVLFSGKTRWFWARHRIPGGESGSAPAAAQHLLPLPRCPAQTRGLSVKPPQFGGSDPGKAAGERPGWPRAAGPAGA